jgi:hypothetical protein
MRAVPLSPQHLTHMAHSTTTNNSNNQQPLFMLILAGLKQIRNQETDLQSRLSAPIDEAQTGALELELQNLSARSDRFHRMLDAMSPMFV